MDPQLIQAMGAMSVAERQRKHYASKTEEEKKAYNKKKTEQARLRREAKRAGGGAGADSGRVVARRAEATKEEVALTTAGYLEVEFNGKDYLIDPKTRFIYEPDGRKLGAPETHPRHPAYVAPAPEPEPKPKPKPKPEPKEKEGEYAYDETMDESDEREATQAEPDPGWEARLRDRLKANLQMDTPLETTPRKYGGYYEGTPWGRLTGETIRDARRADTVYKGNRYYDRGVGVGLFYNGGIPHWADEEIRRGISKEDGRMYVKGEEDGWMIRRSMMEALSNSDTNIRKVHLSPIRFSSLLRSLPDVLRTYTMPKGLHRRRKGETRVV